MKHSSAISHIRQLCSLGLKGEVIAAAVMRSLHEVVPADSNAFFWVDDHHQIRNVYAERVLPSELMGLYFRKYYGDKDVGFRRRLEQVLEAPYGVKTANLSARFYRSDYYNLVWRDLNAHHALYAVARDGPNVVGQISLYRSASDPPFSKADERALAGLTHYLGLGFGDRVGFDHSSWDHAFHDSEESGLIAADEQGHIKLVSPHARKLMLLAFHGVVSPQSILATDDRVLPPQLQRLCQDLRNTFRGAAADPPVLHTENPWGRFVFRAQWLENASGSDNALIGITVHHQHLRPLALLSRLRPMPLSDKQRQVVLYLASGQSHADIAGRMNVSVNTANYHVKQVYEKLDIHNRSELLPKLLLPSATR